MPFSTARLRQRRQALGYTQAQLGKTLGIAPQQIAKWEQAVSTPEPAALARLSQALHCTTDWLLELADEPTGASQPQPLSDAEWQLIQLYRQRDLPDLIQRLVLELARGPVQEHTVVEGAGEAQVAP